MSQKIFLIITEGEIYSDDGDTRHTYDVIEKVFLLKVDAEAWVRNKTEVYHFDPLYYTIKELIAE